VNFLFTLLNDVFLAFKKACCLKFSNIIVADDFCAPKFIFVLSFGVVLLVIKLLEKSGTNERDFLALGVILYNYLIILYVLL
jgi:hypothetical protein